MIFEFRTHVLVPTIQIEMQKWRTMEENLKTSKKHQSLHFVLRCSAMNWTRLAELLNIVWSFPLYLSYEGYMWKLMCLLICVYSCNYLLAKTSLLRLRRSFAVLGQNEQMFLYMECKDLTFRIEGLSACQKMSRFTSLDNICNRAVSTLQLNSLFTNKLPKLNINFK